MKAGTERSSGLWVNAPYDISRRIRNPVTPILVYQLVNSYQEQKIYFDRQILSLFCLSGK